MYPTFQSSFLPCLTCFSFVLVPNGAGAAKFAVKIGIAALKTFLTQIDAVLGAHVAGFSIRMIHTFPHVTIFVIPLLFVRWMAIRV